jgi:zinc protease
MMRPFLYAAAVSLAASVASAPVSAQVSQAKPLAATAMRSAIDVLNSPDTITSSFTVDGLTVILRRNDASNVVAANLYLLGGSRQVTAANAGVEPFLLSVSERGTQHYPRSDIRRKLSLLGSDIVVVPRADWTMIGVRTITQVFDSTWAIFADRVMHPSLDSVDVELVRSQLLSGVRQERDDPDALVESLADSAAFTGHPYSISVTGAVGSIQSITRSDLRRYQETQMVKSRMLLVVVGDMTRAHIESLVRRTLGRLPRGSYTWSQPPLLTVTPGPATIVQRALPTNYILGYFGGPLASGEDYQALRVATTVLTGRMFGEIRSRQNLTYDVHAPFLDRAATAGGLYVTTVSPDTTLKLMRYFVSELQRETLTTMGLKRLELEFITDYFMDNETNASQADFLARAQLYQGDYRHASNFVEELRAVTPDAVRRVAQKYFRNIKFAYVGDPSKVTHELLESF